MQEFFESAKHHALKDTPKETCGIVVDNIYYPCVNISDTPEDNFTIHPKDYLKVRSKGIFQYIIHSHPEGGDASEPDKKACKASKIPWYVYLIPQDEWQIINP